MMATAPFRWTDPATWPWMFCVWVAFALAGLAKPAWSWLRRKRAAGWPVAEGRIESVEITKPSLSFTARRGYSVAELGYSYPVAGTPYSGRQPNTKPRSSFVTLKVSPWQSTATRPALPILHCSNLTSRTCCKTALPPQLPSRSRKRTPFPNGSGRSSGSSSCFLASVSSSVCGFISEP